MEYWWICKCGEEVEGGEELDELMICPSCKRIGCFTLSGACPECGDYKPEDERVQQGMKCGQCAYGSGNYFMEKD